MSEGDHRSTGQWKAAFVQRVLVYGCLMLVLMAIVPELVVRVLNVAWLTAFGWVHFLRRVLPNVTVDMPQVWVTVAAIVVFVAGLHIFLRWLARASGTMPDRRWTASIATLVLFMFVAGTAMVGVVHQVVWLARTDEAWFVGRAREAAYRTVSATNLRTISHAGEALESVAGVLVEGSTSDGEGNRLHGWMVALLPYLEQQALYARIRLDEPWDGPINREVFATPVQAYRSPGLVHNEEPPDFSIADYASNSLVVGPGPPMRIDSITDGTSKTILFGEGVAGRKPWGHPENWRDPSAGLDRDSPEAFGGPWKDGTTIFVFGDSHVARIAPDVDPRVLRALATPQGGERVPVDAID